jgi:hypothetical protein
MKVLSGALFLIILVVHIIYIVPSGSGSDSVSSKNFGVVPSFKDVFFDALPVSDAGKVWGIAPDASLAAEQADNVTVQAVSVVYELMQKGTEAFFVNPADKNDIWQVAGITSGKTEIMVLINSKLSEGGTFYIREGEVFLENFRLKSVRNNTFTFIEINTGEEHNAKFLGFEHK